jgi:GntR family transcriptional regulator
MKLAQTPIPLYYQLETVLRKKIFSGYLKAGDFLPSEEELSREYGISRITVRQALANLERDGLVLRRRGKGTSVQQRPAGFEPLRFSGFIEDLIDIGVRTETRVLDFSKSVASKEVAGFLGLPLPAEVIRIERLRMVEGDPFAFIVEFLPVPLGERIEPDDLTVKPLLSILEDGLKVRPAEADQSIAADSADTRVAGLLNIKVGDPVLKVERTHFDSAHKPIFHASILYRADKYHITVHLERRYSEEGARWAPYG